ncbi:MAG: tyrosine-protein phosphatase [Bacteroidales bacterium]|nr:tyrosine-protein phosphatase [Bacteroidales bacterium]
MQFDSIVNVRDLGGLPAGGGIIRPGRLLRTAHLAEASDADVRRLAEEYHLRKIFDFRTLSEASAMPDREIPGAEHILLPTLDQEAERATGDAVPAETWLDLPRQIVRLSFEERFQRKARELYPSLVLSEFSQLQYAAFLNMILETPDGAVLWHCSQGKDRTGIGAAFLLGAVGADRETIVADFDRSNTEYAPLVQRLCREVEAMGGGEKEKDVVRAFMGVSTKNFCSTLDLIEKEWGSLQGYLNELLGITRTDMQVLQRRYIQL